MRNACVACTFLAAAAFNTGTASAQDRAVLRSPPATIKPALPRSERPIRVEPAARVDRPARPLPAMPPQAGKPATPLLTPLTPMQPPVVPRRLAVMREAGADLKALTQELVTRHGPPPAAAVGRPDAPPLPRAKAPDVLRDLAARSDGSQKDRLLAIAAKLEAELDDLSGLSQQDQQALRREWADFQEAVDMMSNILKQQHETSKQLINNIKG